jgi:uncharacterized repeat protein (TIGR02543 family)
VKRKAWRIAAALLGVVTTLSLFGCLGAKTRETDLYIYASARGGVAIVGLKGDAITMDPLQFPSEIKGKSVVQIGRQGGFMSPDLQVANKADKAILPYTVDRLYKNAFEAGKDPEKFQVVVSYGGIIDMGDKEGNNFAHEYYFIGEVLEQMKEKYNADTVSLLQSSDGFFFYEVTVQFRFNYEKSLNDGYFLCDYVLPLKKLTEPIYPPQRKNYTFAGWYTESECENKWDFDKVKPHGKIMSLYAKWNKK